jgi:methionine synthase II (cobalamin-independent)
MLTVTRDLKLPTAITGSYPRPLWFDQSLNGRSFKTAMGDSIFREQYLDAVAAVINAQEAAGLDIVTDGDTRFDLAVGGKSWFFYPIERLVITTDCGFGREGLSRRIAYYKCVALVEGANIVRRELGLPEAS